MPTHQQPPVGNRLFGRAIRFAVPGPLRRRWLRWRWLSGPLPQDWWPQFEREFRAYCGTSGGRRTRQSGTDR